MDNNTIEIQSQVPGGLWAGTIIPQEMAIFNKGIFRYVNGW